MGEIAWEEVEKVGLRHFANLRKKTKGEMGVNYIKRLNTIQGTLGYKVFKCAMKYGSDKAKDTVLKL